MPAPLVLDVTAVPVSMRVAVTSTSGTTALLGSFTTPLSVAVSIWANTGTPARTYNASKASRVFTRRAVGIISPLPVYAHRDQGFVPVGSRKSLLRTPLRGKPRRSPTLRGDSVAYRSTPPGRACLSEQRKDAPSVQELRKLCQFLREPWRYRTSLPAMLR